MVHEDQNICSNNNHSSNGCENGGGSNRSSSSKKLKHKKVPQRGLGVAQLEKIRIEEQQKKDVNFTPPSTMSSTISPTLPISPLPIYAHANDNDNGKKSKSPVPCSPPSPPPPPPPPPPLSSNLRSTTLSSRIHLKNLMPNIEDFQFASIPPLNSANGGGFSIGWPTIPVNGNINLPKLWPPFPHEYSPDHKLNNYNNNLSFPTNLSLPYETCSVAPLPELVPKVNGVSLVSSSSSSSVLSFPMEPPSNQSFNSNYSPLWPDEEKMMVGTKRTCPFPLDDPPIPIFQNGKFASIANHTLSRAGELTSCANGGTSYNLDPLIPIFRDLPSSPSLIPEPASSRKSSKTNENGHSNGGLLSLSLAPPAITNPYPNGKFKETPMLLASHNREFCNFETLPYQVNYQDSLLNSRQGGSSQQPNCLHFFPLAKVHAPSMTPPANHNSCNGEVGESIDLNLRL